MLRRLELCYTSTTANTIKADITIWLTCVCRPTPCMVASNYVPRRLGLCWSRAPRLLPVSAASPSMDHEHGTVCQPILEHQIRLCAPSSVISRPTCFSSSLRCCWQVGSALFIWRRCDCLAVRRRLQIFKLTYLHMLILNVILLLCQESFTYLLNISLGLAVQASSSLLDWLCSSVCNCYHCDVMVNVCCSGENSSSDDDDDDDEDDDVTGAVDDARRRNDHSVVTKVTSKSRAKPARSRASTTTTPGNVMHIRRALTLVTEQGLSALLTFFCQLCTFLSSSSFYVNVLILLCNI